MRSFDILFKWSFQGYLIPLMKESLFCSDLYKTNAKEQRMNISITSLKVIKIFRDKEPAELLEALRESNFKEKHYPGIGMFYDSSKTISGRQA